MFARKTATGVALVFATSMGAMAPGAPTTVILTPGLKVVSVPVRLVDTESWILGGSGLPIPPPPYLTDVSERFINPSAFSDFSGGKPLFDGQPEFSVDKANPLVTPEQLYPYEGVKELEWNQSVAQGVTILNSTIDQQTAAGNDMVVLGYSQSASIASQEMADLLKLPAGEEPTADQLKFVLIGDPSNPDGGLLSRFDFPGMQQLTIPSLGTTFGGATPADTPWDTAIYTQEYDGFADFPRYPTDLLSDINAILGLVYVHPTYPIITADQVATAIPLATSADYTGHTDYFMIPTQTLPLLEPLLSAGGFGKAIYDLLEPDMRILVNLGYGSITEGWDQGPANVDTPFGLSPDMNWGDVLTALANGAKTGWGDFVSDLKDSSTTATAGNLLSGAAGDPSSFTDIVNAFSGALSHAYAALLPTADILNALTTSVPAYEASLFTHFLDQGDLTDALGMPIGVQFALDSVAGGFELRAIENAFSAIAADFSGLSS